MALLLSSQQVDQFNRKMWLPLKLFPGWSRPKATVFID